MLVGLHQRGRIEHIRVEPEPRRAARRYSRIIPRRCAIRFCDAQQRRVLCTNATIDRASEQFGSTSHKHTK